MDIERETVLEAAAAIVPALLAVVALYVVGATFSGEEGLSPAGGQAIVAVIVGFLLLLTAVGVARSRSE